MRGVFVFLFMSAFPCLPMHSKIFCTHCGKLNQAPDVYCIYCGLLLDLEKELREGRVSTESTVAPLPQRAPAPVPVPGVIQSKELSETKTRPADPEMTTPSDSSKVLALKNVPLRDMTMGDLGEFLAIFVQDKRGLGHVKGADLKAIDIRQAELEEKVDHLENFIEGQKNKEEGAKERRVLYVVLGVVGLVLLLGIF